MTNRWSDEEETDYITRTKPCRTKAAPGPSRIVRMGCANGTV